MRSSGQRQIWAVLAAILLCVTGARAHAQACGDSEWMQRFFLGFVPAARSGHAMCFDVHRGHTVLFGGRLADGTLSNGTWIYDGVAWTQILPPLSPSAREQHAMVYDSERDRVYMFGGMNAAGLTNHTYEFNPETNIWTQLFPLTNPTARMGHSMCYDSARRRIVLMGGEVADAALSGATWEFDPGAGVWSQFAGAGPSPRAGHAMCFDRVRGIAVLFGGRTNAESVSPGTFSNAVWEFNGTVWNARTTLPQLPSPRSGHTMVFDTEQSKSVIIGGRGDANADGVFEYSNATWAYDGAGMVQTTPTIAPTVRAEHGAAYDEGRKRTVLLGGLLANNTRSGATLEYGHIEAPRVTMQPETLTLDTGENAIFAVLDDGHLTSYQWFKGDVQLWDFGVVTGATTRQLVVNSVTEGDEGAYWCRITNVCGETDSEAAILTVTPPPPPPCVLDLNGDHRVDALDGDVIQETMGLSPGNAGWVAAADLNGDEVITEADAQILSDHLAQYGPSYCEGFECPADFNVNGQVTADDIFAFLDAWFVQNGQTGSPLSADIDGNDIVTADDIFAFLDAWFVANGVGCD